MDGNPNPLRKPGVPWGWCVRLLFVLLLAITTPPRDAAADAFDEARFAAALHHADTYYWFGMAERGNMRAYAKGLAHLGEAESLLASSSLPPAERGEAQARIDALRADLDEQAEIGHDTLYGVFPLFRFFAPTLFADQTNLATFELLDEPTVVVTTAASRQLAWAALKNWTPKAQLDAVFVSQPRDEALENEALYVFNAIPKFFVHNQREAVEALTPDQREAFFRGTLTPEIRDALLDGFGIPELLVVLVRGVDVVDGDTFSIVEGRLIDRTETLPRHRFQVMGFSRDRRMWFVPLLVATGGLLALAYLLFALLLRSRARATMRVSPVTYLVVPLLAFLVGRATPWALGPALRSVAPDPENLAIISFWAPLTAGLAIVVLPMILYWAVAARLARVFPALTFEGRGAATCVAIGTGVVAYLAVPAFLYQESLAWVALAVLTPAVGGIAYLLGRALDPAERLHGGFALLAGVLAMAVVGAFLHGRLPWSLAAAGAVGLVLAVVEWATGSRRRVTAAAQAAASRSESLEAPTRGDAQDLVTRATRPVFQTTAAFTGAWERLAPFRTGRAQRLGIRGGPGSGLSRALTELARRHEPAVVLFGRGREREAPYGPFREALATHFEVDLLVARASDAPTVDQGIGGMLGSLVPFGSLLFPDTSGLASESSQENLHASVLWALKRLATKQRVLLVLDNLQAFDTASANLLAYLVREFPAGEDIPLLLLVGSHEMAPLVAAGFEAPEEIAELGYPGAKEQATILVDGVGLRPEAAREVLDSVGLASESTRGLTWLLRVVSDLGRADAFESSPHGFSLAGGRLPGEIRLPREMGDVVARHLDRSPGDRPTLAAAACAARGREFDVETLRRVLDVTRLELIERLDRIERETGIVRDVGERDDVYAFASTFMLEAVRDELRVRDAGPDDTEVPQRIRELHARLARILEGDLARDPGVLYRIANHYYAAGARQAAEAVHYGLLAARAHAAIADEEGCAADLARAEECARHAGRERDVREARLALRAQRAQLTASGEALVRAAREGARQLEATPDASLEYRLAVGQLVYEAGKRHGDAALMETAARVGQDIVGGATTPLEEAAGRHLVGVSLPPARADERTRQLERALELLDGAPAPGPDATRLLGRVLGSLAEAWLSGPEPDEARARELLERRLTLLETSGVGDLRGLAMTHGALGRLALAATPRNPDLARIHLAKDLELSTAIGDVAGQVQMHSLLGACALEDGDLDRAREHYGLSWSLGEDVRARCFSGAGLLRTHAAAGDRDALAQVARDLDRVLPPRAADVAADGVEALARAVDVVTTRVPDPPVRGLERWLAGGR